VESKIWISRSDAEAIKKFLYQDVEFLKSMELMDYSLLVTKLKLQQYANDQMKPIQAVLKENFWGKYHCVPSEKEPGIFYSFGVIDYLQEWNIKKNLEKTMKKLINIDPDLDTSA
jgi:hypothetical protein